MMRNDDTETLVRVLCEAFDRMAQCDAECAQFANDHLAAKSSTLDRIRDAIAPALPILIERGYKPPSAVESD